MSQPSLPDWFIDIRQLSTSEHISLDLARHLPRRAAVGAVAVIADRPAVLLSVVRKRWSIIIREVQRQYSSTLQPAKKEGLQRELLRLQGYIFSIAAKRTAATNILFATPHELYPEDRFSTIYLTIPLPHERLMPIMDHLSPRGFLVTYTGWPDVPSKSSAKAANKKEF
jgi:hypothetical protein